MREDDFKWFIDNYNELYQQYGHSYLAIKNKTVLGSYKTVVDAVNETSESEEPGTFIVQECNGKESGYTNYISSWQLA